MVRLLLYPEGIKEIVNNQFQSRNGKAITTEPVMSDTIDSLVSIP